jgi:hypothetical protein
MSASLIGAVRVKHFQTTHRYDVDVTAGARASGAPKWPVPDPAAGNVPAALGGGLAARDPV